MLVVTGIKITKIPGNAYTHRQTDHEYGDPVSAINRGLRGMTATTAANPYGFEENIVRVTQEDIKGKSFKNQNGERVIIGMSKEIEHALGLPLEWLEKQASLIRRQGLELRALKKELELLKKTPATVIHYRKLKDIQ